MADPLEVAAQALADPTRFGVGGKVTVVCRAKAKAAIAAWLEAVGMDFGTMMFFADRLPSRTIRQWAEAVRAVEQGVDA